MTYWDPQNAPDVEDTDDPAELVEIDIAMNRDAFEAAEAERKLAWSDEEFSVSNLTWSDDEFTDEDTDRGDR